jgi:hypothetical protein
MINRPKLSSLLPTQVPEFVREDYTTFVDFLKAYYEFIDQNYDTQFTTLRDLDTTLDSFLDHFKNELAHNIPYTVVNERFLLERIKDQYLAKGSEASFKLLFKMLFNKEVVVDYPSTQILRASDGRWNQDVSIFVYVNAGDPEMVVGKLVDVITPNRIIRLQVDKRQYVEIEVDNVIQISENVYELFIDRRFFGDINIGDKIRYSTTFDATILATTSTIEIQREGKKFKIGELYEVRNGQGAGSILKVARVNSTGGIEALEFVRYGIGYTTEFTANLLPYGGTSATTAGATGLTISGSAPNTSVAFSETTNGFFEQGIINKTDYNVTEYWDGTYVGETVREFFVDNKYAILDPDEPAVVKITLGALAKYPGYYTTNNGFLDDAIYIQDSRYYQAFAYVLKIDERLDTYRSAVKTLLHPAGMALFGEFDIRNEFDTGTSLEFALKYLVLAFQDEVQTAAEISAKNVGKAIANHYLNDGVTADANFVTLSSEVGSGTTRTVPYLVSSKALATHYLNDGITEDTSHVTLSSEVGEDDERTVPFFGVSKRVNSSYLNDGTTLDDNTVTPSEATIEYDYDDLTRKGISVVDVEKTLSANQYPYYLYGGVTLGSDSISLADTTGTNGARTMPYVEMEKALDTHYLNSAWTSWPGNVLVQVGARYRAGNYVYEITVSGTTHANDLPDHTSGTEINGTATALYLGVYTEIADTSSVVMDDETGEDGTRTVPYVEMEKSLATHYLNDGETEDTSEVTPTDTDGEDDERTVPFFGVSKTVNSTYLNDGTTLDDNTLLSSEETYEYGYSTLSRIGISETAIIKTLDSTAYNHYLNNGSTLDTDLFSLSDTTGTGSLRTMPYVEMEKSLDSHKLYDNSTSDQNTVALSDTTGTDSERTVPYIVLNKSISATSLNYDEELDDETVGVTDSGGSLWLSPYADPYPISNAYFLNDGGNYTTGESAFTG